jgi:hypothetical protein
MNVKLDGIMIVVINMKNNKYFNSDYHTIKFIEKNIKFNKNYGYAPELQIFIERLNIKTTIPLFIIGRNKIQCTVGRCIMLCNPIEYNGFWLNYEKHSYKDIIFHVAINLENGQIERKIIDFKNKILINKN